MVVVNRRAVVFSHATSPSPDVAARRLLSSSVLVLNRYYLAVHVISVRRAFILLYRDGAEVIDIEAGHYANYDFAAWCEVSSFRSLESKQPHEDWIRAVSFEIQLPRIIRLLAYDRVPKKSLQFNRRNIFARDGHRCQYCGRSLPLSQLQYRPCASPQPRRQDDMGQRRVLVPRVQHEEGVADAARGAHAADRQADRAEDQPDLGNEAEQPQVPELAVVRAEHQRGS